MKRFITLVALPCLIMACSPSNSLENNNSTPAKNVKLVKEISFDFTDDDIKDNIVWSFAYNQEGKVVTIETITKEYSTDNKQVYIQSSWDIEYLSGNQLHINEKVYTEWKTWENPFIIELNNKGMIDSWDYINYSESNAVKESYEYSYDANSYLTNSLYKYQNLLFPTSYIWNRGNLNMCSTINSVDPSNTKEFIYNNISTSKTNIDISQFITYPSEVAQYFTLPIDDYCKISIYLLGAGYIGKTNANYITEIVKYNALSKPDPFNGRICKFQWIFDQDNCPTKCIVTHERIWLYYDELKSDIYKYSVDIKYVE